jgi:Transposase, Mutator family
VVGREPSRQPHHLEIAASLALEPPAGLHAVEIAVDVELEQNRRFVTGPPRRHRLGTVKPRLDQIERLDKHIHRADRIILVDPILKALRQQSYLPAVHPFNKPRHPSPPPIQRANHSRTVFSHSLGQVLPCEAWSPATAETKKDALAALDAFVETWGVKYDKTVECLIKDREALLAFYNFPAELWKHLRTTNVIESSFATIRHRTVRAKGCLSNKTALAMIFKLAEAAEKSWRRLDGHNQLPKDILGIKFTDGIEVIRSQAQAAA